MEKRERIVEFTLGGKESMRPGNIEQMKGGG